MLKKDLKNWLETFNTVTIPALIKNGFKATPINAREGLANLTKSLVTDIPSVERIYDDIILTNSYNIPTRIYVPNSKENLPVLIYFHGGGHMGGSVTVYDPICRKLANNTNHIVIAIEYRLAPENPYPCGVIDSYNSLKYIWNTLDSREIKYKKILRIGGDSAGGALTATVAMKAQNDYEIKIDKMFMIYPSLDYTMSFPSIKTNSKGFLLESTKIKWYFDNYFQNNENLEDVSPIFNNFSSKLPQTLIFTAEYCPLKDEGIEYAEKLKEYNVPVEHYNLENMIHTFMNMENLCSEECSFVYNKINNFLNS